MSIIEPSLQGLRGITITTWPSTHDTAVVVQVDTTEHTGRVRVNINDAPVYDADPEKPQTPSALQAAEVFADVDEARYRLLCIAATLGSRAEWNDPADILEGIAYEVGEALAAGTPHVGDGSDAAALAFWRRVADANSIAHDGPEEA